MLMTKRRIILFLVLVLIVPVLATGGLVGLYYGLVGFPATPMTVERADRMFGNALRPGMSWEEVKAWLTSQDIPRKPRETPGASFDILRRREDITFKGWWMDCRGNKTVAECAGLSVDEVFWIARVCYPEADRFFLGSSQITVYLFFDSEDRLIKHWVDEFVISL